MRSALDLLIDLGAWALPAVWLPVLAWTALALVAEAALRLRPHPLLSLGVRRSLLWALPAGVLAALALPGVLPSGAVEQVLAMRPTGLALPTIEVGVAPGADAPMSGPSASPLPLAPLVAGLALLPVVAFALVRLGRVTLGLARLGRLAEGAAPEEVQRETEAAALAAGVTRRIRAVATDVPTVPFTFGWRRPVVVVPAGLAEDGDALRLILAHEVAHVARGDFAAGVAERMISAAFGWHPLVGALARRVDLDRERATDAAVLAGHPSRRRDYASLLLSFSRLPSPALALGAAPGSGSLTTRITDMNRAPLSPHRLRQIGYAARLVGAAMFVLAVGAAALVAIGPAKTQAVAASLGSDAILIASPVVSIDGVEVFEGDGDLTTPSFGVLNVAVGGWGRFLVSDQPFGGAAPAGSFDLDHLQVQAGGHTLRIDLGEAPFAERRERRAYARFDAFPDAAPLAPGDPRIGDVWFSVSASVDGTMPVRATYHDRMLIDSSSDTIIEDMDGAIIEDLETTAEAGRLVIEGRVVDALTGRPLVGANVVVVGTSIGAATDLEGRFVINGVDPGDAQIRITFVGYQPLTVVPQAGEPLRIGLVPESADAVRDRMQRGRKEFMDRMVTGERASDIDPNDPDAPEVFDVVEGQPVLKGGIEGLQRRVQYPPLARNAGIEGTVYVQFVVNEQGDVQNAVCARSPDEILCAAALEAVTASEFEPGRQRGQAVKVRFTVPVRFLLDDE